MGINWGIALGAGAQAAMNTYERLGEEELREMQRKKLKEEMEQDAALAASIKKASAMGNYSDVTSGQDVGTVAEKALNFTPEQMAEFKSGLSKLTPEQQQNVLRAYSGTEHDISKQPQAIPADGQTAPRQAGLDLSKVNVYQGKEGQALATTETGKRRSQNDIYKDVAAEMAATGNLRGYKEALTIKNAARESELNDRFDSEQSKLNDTLARIKGTAESRGLQGLAEEAEKEGLKVKFVSGANGIGKVNILGPKGDVIETITDVNAGVKKLYDVAMQDFQNRAVGMFGSIDKAAAFMQRREELGFKGREVAVKEAIAPSEINKNNAQAGAASMSAAVAGETLKDKRAARDAVRPFMDAYAKLSPEEQKGEKGQALLDQAEAGAAIKFGDISTLRKNSPVAKAEAGYERLYLESKKEADKNGEQFTPPDRAQYYGRVHGIASPEVVNLAQQRVNELIAAGKTKEAKAAVSEHNKIFYSPGSKIKLPE